LQPAPSDDLRVRFEQRDPRRESDYDPLRGVRFVIVAALGDIAGEEGQRHRRTIVLHREKMLEVVSLVCAKNQPRSFPLAHLTASRRRLCRSLFRGDRFLLL